MPKPEIQDLQNSAEFKMILELRHGDVLPFIFDQLKKNNSTILCFKFLSVILAISLLSYGIWLIWAGQLHWSKSIGLGVVGIFLGTTIVIPLHELIHGIAYRVSGASSVIYGGSFKEMAFYAIADKFVIGMPWFRFVALAPFTIISILCLIALNWGSQDMRLLSLGFLASHTVACAGDFGLLGFISSIVGSELYTYDDAQNKVSYFYEKLTEGEDEEKII